MDLLLFYPHWFTVSCFSWVTGNVGVLTKKTAPLLTIFSLKNQGTLGYHLHCNTTRMFSKESHLLSGKKNDLFWRETVHWMFGLCEWKWQVCRLISQQWSLFVDSWNWVVVPQFHHPCLLAIRQFPAIVCRFMHLQNWIWRTQNTIRHCPQWAGYVHK